MNLKEFREKIDLLCPDCKQDHAQPLKHWCDNSDLEIQFYKLKQRASEIQSENTKLHAKLDLAEKAFSNILLFGDLTSRDYAKDALAKIKEMDK
jgi:hypothetical protein